MLFPIRIDHEPDSAFGVVVPDLPGCFSAGDTLEKAIENTRDAVLLWAEDTLEHGETLPEPRPLADHMRAYAAEQVADPLPDTNEVIWTVIRIESEFLRPTNQRLNISLPASLVARADAEADRAGLNRSQFIAMALRSALGEHHSKAS